MYFTRSLAKRLKVNQEIRDHYGGQLRCRFNTYDEYIEAIESHEDYDFDAEEWGWEEGSRWVETMKRMRYGMDFDVDKIKKLHPEKYWGFGHAKEVTECWAWRADMDKLTWIYEEVIKNPIVITRALSK